MGIRRVSGIGADKMMIVGEKPICLSGGAVGWDMQWGMCAGMLGHMVVHWSFKGHRTKCPPSEVAELTPDQLLEADPYLHRANKTLMRTFPPKSPHATNLLRRNWYQVRDADSVYAGSEFDERGLVVGGTAWAVQMFIDRHNSEACSCYVFDQINGKWFKWEGRWEPIQSPPVPTGIWAGIGSRTLLPAGKQAIRTLLEYEAQN